MKRILSTIVLFVLLTLTVVAFQKTDAPTGVPAPNDNINAVKQ